MEIINRDNYETWLMLYLDNELTAEEREAVEAFASANPFVQEELNGLKEVLLQPEFPAAMPGKERLLMPEIWNEEALTRQQEQMLLLADKALPAGDEAMLETEIENDPLLQKEWQLLQATIIRSEEPAEMPFKERLYRQEPARIIPFGRIIRFAAAAAILAFGWFAIDRMSGSVEKDTTMPQVVKVEPENGEQQHSVTEEVNRNDREATEERKGDEIGDGKMAKTEIVVISPIQKNKPVEKQINKDVSPLVAVIAQTSEEENVVSNRDMTNKIASVTYVDVEGVDATQPIAVNNLNSNVLETVQQEQKNMVSYEVVDADELLEDESISIAGARISKQKIRGFYRNITRPLARSFEKNQAPRTEVK